MKIKKFKVLFKTIPLAYRASKKLFIIDVLLSIISGFFGVVVVHATTKLFNAVSANIAASQKNTIILALSLYFGVLISKIFIDMINDAISFIISEKSIIALSELIHKKANDIETTNFENAKLIDSIENAGGGLYYIDYCSKNIINLFLRDIPYLLFVGCYLYSLKPVLFFIPILIFIPVIVSEFLRTTMFVELKNEQAPLERKLSRYNSYMTEPEFFKETRTLGCFLYFKNLYVNTLNLLNKKQWKTARSSQTIEVLSRLITLIGYYGVLFLLFTSLMKRAISIGEFAAVFASMQMLYDTANHIFVERIGPLLTDEFAEINSVIDYFEIPNRVYGQYESDSNNDDIDLKNVSFSYPGRNEMAIQGINLHIKKGETIAIVGLNGSGKTTLAKIILGIYMPTQGNIYSGSISYSDLSREALFDNKSAVFQNYYKYLFNLRENVTISDAGLKIEWIRVKNACQNANVPVDNITLFPLGYETLLSKRFGGVDLSGGEWQREAIARGLYRNSNIVVLDEPTAAIDPIEEGNIYRKFIDISAGKTAVIITHRLGSARIADRIIVMEGGAIVQTGTHDTLMKENGLYKTMFESQAQWYKD